MSKAIVLLAMVFSSFAFAADTPASLAAKVRKDCFAYAKSSLADDMRKDRGGTCTATRVTVDPATAKRGFVAPMSAIREVPVIEAFGEITIHCSAALFFAEQTFVQKIRFLAGPFNHGDCSVQNKSAW